MSLSSVPEAVTTLQGADNLVTEQLNVLTGVYDTMGSVIDEINTALEYFTRLQGDLEGHEMPSFKPAEIVETLGTLHGTVEENRSKIEELETHLQGIHENFETTIVEAGGLTSGS